MSVEKEYYLSCSGCGLLYTEDGRAIKTDCAEDVRDEAVENGWLCYVGSGEDEDDYCPECKKDHKPDDD